mgnify:CR=1 FL=1
MSLTVIHFSDIHIKTADDVILKRVRELKTACVSSLPSNGDVIISISGDIAFSGSKQQYNLAKNLIDEIAEYIFTQKGSRVYVAMVPGNHDCDFSSETSVRKTLIDSVHPSKIDLNYYSNVAGVQDEYQEFAKSYGIATDTVLPRLEIKCGDYSVLFTMVNSAWMSILNEKPGKLIIPCHLYEEVSPEKYKVVFYMFHHPISWLNPDLKRQFVDHVRQNADIILLGHEHERDSYNKIGATFSVYCSHGKELQNNDSGESAFTVINFDSVFQNYDIIDFKWNGEIYDRCAEEVKNQYHKNIAAKNNVLTPNENIMQQVYDIGIVINHFAKENVTLPDLFVWPDLRKSDLSNEKGGSVHIRTNTVEELYTSSLIIFTGESCSGKTSIAKFLFLHEQSLRSCSILINGVRFVSADEERIRSVIEDCYSEQYSKRYIEEFRQLPKEQRTVIVDDFDLIKNIKGRRSAVLDYLYGFFGRVIILLSSNLELTTLIASNSIKELDHVVCYEILPLGNKKRREIISKWYHLNETYTSEEDISNRINNATEKINAFLGNGNAFIPASPIFVLSVLQNIDAVQQQFGGSKFGYLYETLIISSLSIISENYSSAGNYEVDIGILSNLAYKMLQEKRTGFTTEQIEEVVSEIGDQHLLQISYNEFLQRMISAKIICNDTSYGNLYRFVYPYIFYYFCGKFIAYHLNEPSVQKEIEYMSARLYNETYGNIIIFLCHFANNSSVVDSILLNAYDTLESYETFDFTKTNPVFDKIKDAVELLIPRAIASSDADVLANEEVRLSKLDEAGIGDGRVTSGEDTINDEISEKEKDLAAVVAALKTIEVLGEILQNYPVGLDRERKLEIIEEMHKLGMRSVQAIIDTMGYLENDLIEYIFERASNTGKRVSKEEVGLATRRFINLIVSVVARGMIHQIATSLNSDLLLPAAKKALEGDSSISSKLVLLDLKLNCLKHCEYSEIEKLKKEFEANNEKFALKIIDSIVGEYLNYTKCDHVLRAKLCSLCGLPQRESLIATQRNLLN